MLVMCLSTASSSHFIPALISLKPLLKGKEQSTNCLLHSLLVCLYPLRCNSVFLQAAAC